jgi:hypothetical protein
MRGLNKSVTLALDIGRVHLKIAMARLLLRCEETIIGRVKEWYGLRLSWLLFAGQLMTEFSTHYFSEFLCHKGHQTSKSFRHGWGHLPSIAVTTLKKISTVDTIGTSCPNVVASFSGLPKSPASSHPDASAQRRRAKMNCPVRTVVIEVSTRPLMRINGMSMLMIFILNLLHRELDGLPFVPPTLMRL